MKSTLKDVFGEDAFHGGNTVSFKINGKEFDMDSTYTLERMMNTVNGSNAGVKMSYDTIRGTFSMESTEVGAKNAIRFEDPDGFLSNAIGLRNETSAKDAIISLDGVATSRETNNFTIDDMDISLTDDAVGKEFTVEVKRDTSKTMEFVKNFVEEYNKLVDTLHDAYGTSRPKSDKYTYYEPLSDDEKEAMKEADIEKYEEKAKEGLLYRDSILSGIGASLRSMLYEPMEMENGESISLFEIGITTEYDTSGGYGRITIDETKLGKALEEKGDAVIELFTKASDVGYSDTYNRAERRKTEGIAYRIEDIIKDATSTTNGTLAQKAGIEKTSTVTENELSRMLEQQDQRIADMLKMLTDKEDSYYAMFSKLETAMTQANSQMASVQSMLGGGM
jgi:flagellar hook-associated protein 2